jgi:alkyl sulfatase BDS1-like metallo-beta-lactamase superfamily hydrolase
MKLPNGKLGVITAVMFFAGAAVAAPPSQYNMSLTAQPVETPIGAITHPYAATADEVADTESKTVKRITDGVYRLGGWGIANTIAVEGPEGWVIVDAGDNLEAAQEQRQRLEAVVGKIKVAGVVYTHSHYVWGAKAWQDEGTEFYGHEDLVSNLNADQGVSVLSGNFMTRAVAQFGMLHPKQGSDAFPNHYGFSAEKLSGTKAFVPPGVTFEDGAVEQHTIGGLTVEVLPHKTDVQDSLAYYFPEKKLLSTNGMNAPVIFNLYTLRGDWYRDPMVFVEAADLVLTRDVEFHVDVHGSAKIGRERVKTGLQETRDQMQLLHDQTYRAIALGKDAQDAAEWIYMPEDLRQGRETYGQVESHVKRVYGARIGWMGWDVYDINPLSKSGFSGNMIRAMGGFDVVLAAARDANTKQTIADWQWALYLSSQLMIADPTNAEVKATRAEAARALGQRTSSANARGWYISEALLQEGKMQYAGHTVSQYQQLSHVLGAVTPQKLASSPVRDNVYYLRYMVDTRLAEGKRAAFNVHFKEQGLSYGIALRNGIIAITEQHNDGPTIELTKAGWSELITGEKTFAGLHPSLEAFDTTVAR